MTLDVRLAGPQDMAAVFALRHEVFVVGQGVPADLELDELDAVADHALALLDGVVVGTGRLLPSATIGRMAVSADVRGRGTGAALLNLLEQRAAARGMPAVELHAQTHARGFYERAGWSAFGDLYDEAGIEHVSMRKRLTLPAVTATRYVTPLREGGSLPGLMEASDLGTYVVKYVGAGQGRKALVAEVVCGELARRLGLPVPELVTVEVDPLLGRSEPDEEVQDLLVKSGGLNLGMDFLPGALGFDPLVHQVPDPLATEVLWFDALVSNVDRSWRNPNLLLWHRDLWLIDHGACLLFHHSWARAEGMITRPYDAAGHVLAPQALARDSADARLSAAVTPELLESVVALVPEAWLSAEPGFDSAADVRAAYVDHLSRRVAAHEVWRP